MTPQQIARITRHPDFIQLVRRKQRLYCCLLYTSDAADE